MSYIKVDSGSGTGPGEGEAALDIENVIGLAPRASIDVYQGPNTNIGPLDVYNSIINQDRAKIISTSWGICEAQLGGRAVASVEANMFEQAAAQGQTVVAAAGDDGSTDCTNRGGEPLGTLAVDDPGSQPYVTSVGGTSLSPLGPPPSETVWNGGAERRRRRRHLVDVGHARLSSRCRAPATRREVLFLPQALRCTGGLLPGGARRLR